MTSGADGKGTGLVVLTDRRLLFVQHGIMSQTAEDFPRDKVSSIQWSSGMMLGTITAFASGNKAVIKNVDKGDGKEIVDLIRHRLSEQAPRASAATRGGGEGIYEQLRKLGELQFAGVLTDEEFKRKKADLPGELTDGQPFTDDRDYRTLLRELQLARDSGFLTFKVMRDAGEIPLGRDRARAASTSRTHPIQARTTDDRSATPAPSAAPR
jgi:hypothetical protein